MAVELTSTFVEFSDQGTNNRKVLGNNGRQIVAVSSTHVYLFFSDDNADLAYTKSTDGGKTWSTKTVVAASITIETMSIWFDGWTPGDAGTIIHVAYIEAGIDDVLYGHLDTSTDTWTGPVTVFAGASSTTTATIAIWKTRGGNLICVYNIDGGTERGAAKSTNGGTSFSAIADPTEADADQLLGFPGNYTDNQDADLIFWDISANEISIKVYDDSANSWAETSISGSMNDVSPSTCQPQFAGAIRASDGHLILAAWNDRNVSTQDLKTWDINGSGSITAKTDVLTNVQNAQCVGIQIDQSNDYIYCYYFGKSDNSESFTGNGFGMYRKESHDGGATWINELFVQSVKFQFSIIVTDLGKSGTAKVAACAGQRLEQANHYIIFGSIEATAAATATEHSYAFVG